MGAASSASPKVTALERTAAGEWRVRTDQGDILAEILVNAAGYRAGEVTAMLGAVPADRDAVASISGDRGHTRNWSCAARSGCRCSRSRRQLLPAPGAGRPAARPLRMAGDARTGSTEFPDISPISCSTTTSAGSRNTSRRRASAYPSWARRREDGHQRPDPLCARRQSADAARRRGLPGFYHCCAFTSASSRRAARASRSPSGRPRRSPNGTCGRSTRAAI